jgi:beta-glucosidase
VEAGQRSIAGKYFVLALASTFDRDLARRLGQAIGEEFSGKGVSEIPGPTVNLARTWHW